MSLRSPLRGRVWSRAALWAVVALIAFSTSGCVYFNTFYHAKKFYNDAEKVRDQAGLRAGASAGKTLYESAIEKASKIVEKHPKSKYHDDALFMIGMCYFRVENFTKSENAFRELLVTHPDSKLNEEARLYLARCRMELGDEQAGFRTFTELAETARKKEWRAEAIFQRGTYFYANESYDSAAVEFRRVLTEFPKSTRAIDARLSAAEALRHLGRYNEAIDLYRPITHDEEHPEINFEALYGIGTTYYEADEPDSGIAVFSAMVDDDRFEDTLGVVRLALGNGLEKIGDYDGAWRQYEQVAAAFEKSPFSAEAYFRMAEIKQFVEEDLVAAKDLYDQSRLEYASGDLSQEALSRSAHISKLEQFRKDLGRGELTAHRRDDEGPYVPADLPRMERNIKYSPLAARPADYKPPGSDFDSTLVQGPATPDSAALAALLATQMADTSAAGAADPLGPATDLAPFLGPPTDSAAIVLNMTRSIPLPAWYWYAYVGSDSMLGPVSPAYLYDYGEGDLLGPKTPSDSLLRAWAFAEVDTAALRREAERDSLRAARKAELDTIRTAATTQLQLAELYRFSLSAPDSAVREYDNMVQRYPNSPFAPKALLGAADVLMDDLKDTVEAQKRLESILRQYPYSDYAGEAIVRLGLQGTDADTAYPQLMYRRAEDTYLAGHDPRRAIDDLEAFIDQYPESRLVPNAEFAIATLRDRYFPREDSSVVLAYEEIQNEYPQSPFADAVAQKLNFRVDRPQRRQRRMVETTDEQLASADKAAGGAQQRDTTQVGAGLPLAPRPNAPPNFVYPQSEVGTYDREMRNVYKIWIDFTGTVTEVEPLQESPSSAINESAEQAVKNLTFNPDSIAIDSLNMYYRYDLRIVPPARERDEFDRLGVPQINTDDPNKP